MVDTYAKSKSSMPNLEYLMSVCLHFLGISGLLKPEDTGDTAAFIMCSMSSTYGLKEGRVYIPHQDRALF